MIPLIWTVLSKVVKFIDRESVKVVAKGWVLQGEIVPEIGCPKIWLYLTVLKVYLKTDEVLNFKLCVFCYSWNQTLKVKPNNLVATNQTVSIIYFLLFNVLICPTMLCVYQSY